MLLNKNATRFPGRCGDARPAAREGEIAALKVPEDAPQPGKATRQIPWGLIGGGERRFYFSFGLEPTTDLVVALLLVGRRRGTAPLPRNRRRSLPWRPVWLIGLDPPAPSTGPQSISALANPAPKFKVVGRLPAIYTARRHPAARSASDLVRDLPISCEYPATSAARVAARRRAAVILIATSPDPSLLTEKPSQRSSSAATAQTSSINSRER